MLAEGTSELLRVVLPARGSYVEDIHLMLEAAGYRSRRDGRRLSVLDERAQVEFFFLRWRDIGAAVGQGYAEVGLIGDDLILECALPLKEALPLGFGMTTWRFMAAAGNPFEIEDHPAPRVATSYPRLIASHLRKVNPQAVVVPLEGSVEVAIELGMADYAAEMVTSGATVSANDLKLVGEPILTSSLLFAESSLRPRSPDASAFLQQVATVLPWSAKFR
jgi:ATP phosphoribosyltransferase